MLLLYLCALFAGAGRVVTVMDIAIPVNTPNVSGVGAFRTFIMGQPSGQVFSASGFEGPTSLASGFHGVWGSVGKGLPPSLSCPKGTATFSLMYCLKHQYGFEHCVENPRWLVLQLAPPASATSSWSSMQPTIHVATGDVFAATLGSSTNVKPVYTLPARTLARSHARTITRTHTHPQSHARLCRTQHALDDEELDTLFRHADAFRDDASSHAEGRHFGDHG